MRRVRARAILEGRTVDATPPTPRLLPPDGNLIDFLVRLAPGSGSIALLAACHSGAWPELAELLSRHKISPALLERAGGAFHDPESA